MADAGGGVIGALRVVLGADSAALEKGLKDAQGSINAFAASAAKGAAGIAVGFAAAATALGVSIKHTLAEADKLGKLAQSVGVPVEQLSALKYAADLSGVSVESLGKALGRLSKNTLEAAQGAKGPVEAFRALGVSFRDASGGVKSVGDLLPQLADKFAAMKDGTAKTALAMQIFGRAGAELIPLLNGGSKGIKEMTDEAKQLGLVIDDKTAKSAEAFNDNLTRMGAIFTGIITKVTAQAAPAFAQLSGALVEVSKNSDLIKSIADGISTSLKGAIDTVIRASVVFERLGAEWAAVKAIFAATNFSDLKTAFSNFQLEAEKSQQAIAGMGATVAKFWDSANKNAEAASKHITKKFDPQIINTTKNALDNFIDSTNKHIAAQNAEADAAGKSAGEKERLRIVAEGLAIAVAKNIPLTDALRANLEKLGLSAEQASLRVQGTQLIQNSLPIWQQYQTEIDNARIKLQKAGGTAEDFGRVNEKIAAKYGLDWQTQSASVAGSISNIANTFGQENARMAKIAQVFGALQAFISSYKAASETLATVPFPLNLAAAASVLATGIGFVAAIRSAAMPTGMATGGAIRVGGIGGTDSQLVQIMASPDEQIDVWRPGEGPGDMRRGGWGGTTIIKIPREATQISIGYIEQLIPALNRAFADGHKLKLEPI